MMTKIGIINYRMGNIGSIKSALGFYDYDVAVITRPEEINSMDILILAGVGNFATASERLKKLKFWDKLDEEVTCNEKPVLGICLGMQIFADKGFENGEHAGFGWIRGNVIKMQGDNLRIPHIGWNEITHHQDPLFKGILNNFFYFMHSYHFVPSEKDVEIAWAQYGDLKFVSAVRKKNIAGLQFHPEKSQGDGLRVLRNFVDLMS